MDANQVRMDRAEQAEQKIGIHQLQVMRITSDFGHENPKSDRWIVACEVPGDENRSQHLLTVWAYDERNYSLLASALEAGRTMFLKVRWTKAREGSSIDWLGAIMNVAPTKELLLDPGLPPEA